MNRLEPVCCAILSFLPATLRPHSQIHSTLFRTSGQFGSVVHESIDHDYGNGLTVGCTFAVIDHEYQEAKTILHNRYFVEKSLRRSAFQRNLLLSPFGVLTSEDRVLG